MLVWTFRPSLHFTPKPYSPFQMSEENVKNVQKLSFLEKAGYSLGDAGANLVFQVLMAYQFYFFTAIMGLGPAAAGLLFLIGRGFDAFTDPAMGLIADRTKHRWGRFRPWLVWSALPFAGIFWLTFTSPGWEPTYQMAYAYVMYFALMGIYTVNNVPYCALNGVMTGDVDERTSLSSFRFVAVTITQFIVQGFTWPLVAKLGNTDAPAAARDVAEAARNAANSHLASLTETGADPSAIAAATQAAEEAAANFAAANQAFVAAAASGWSNTMAIFAVITIFLFVVCFFSVKERVQPDPNQETSAKQDMLDTLKNRPWMILFCATMMIFIMLVVRGGSLNFYMEAYVSRAAMGDFLQGLGLQRSADVEPQGFRAVLNTFGLLVNESRTNVPNVAYGMFMMAGTFSTLAGVFASKPLSKLFGKRAVFVTCLFLTACSTMWLFFIPADNIRLMVFQALSWGLCYGPTVPLLWSMIADAADYSEWKTGRRATGFVFSGVVFALKFGLGIGGFVQGAIFSAYGYEGGTELTERAILGVRMASTVYPAVFIIIAASILLFYPISKQLNYQIGAELAERRRQRGDEDVGEIKEVGS